MTIATALVVAVGATLAWANGANDVSKGIATLVGSGVTDLRRAVVWGTAWTAVGGALGAVYAGAMLDTFGHGLLAPGVAPGLSAALAVLLGGAGWVLFATRAGLPVSSTHAIVGSLLGVATLAYGSGAVAWGALGGKVLLPLLATPLVSLLVTGVVLRALRRPPGAPGRADCLCAEIEPAIPLATVTGLAGSTLQATTPHLRITAGPAGACASSRAGALRLTIDHLHWLTSGATSLARGMNDAPKIVALVLAAHLVLGSASSSPAVLYLPVVAAMVLGSLVGGRRVTRVLATGVTSMDHHEGFTANLVTAGLVTAGAVYGLPMSTTHVASGGIFGAGAQRGTLNRGTLRDILLAWVVTLPAAAGLGMAVYAVAAWASA